jgi:broad specificity phosphatase PhoE
MARVLPDLMAVALLLVRHAHALARREWPGADDRRPLSHQGKRQAEGLVGVARNFAPVSRLLSSPSLRCVQTLTPLAKARDMGIEMSEDLAEGERASALKLVRALAGSDVAVCTHGDVIAEILVTLADEDRVDLGPNPRQAKGSVWLLEGGDGSFSSARYFPPVIAETV